MSTVLYCEDGTTPHEGLRQLSEPEWASALIGECRKPDARDKLNHWSKRNVSLKFYLTQNYDCERHAHRPPAT